METYDLSNMTYEESKTSDIGDGVRPHFVTLAAVSEMLRDRVTYMPRSYLVDKMLLRDTVMERLRCSAMLAERVIDRLEANRLVVFERHPVGVTWHITSQPRGVA